MDFEEFREIKEREEKGDSIKLIPAVKLVARRMENHHVTRKHRHYNITPAYLAPSFTPPRNILFFQSLVPYQASLLHTQPLHP